MASNVIVTSNEFAEDGGLEGLRAAIVQTMVRVRSQAVSLAPVGEGELRNSLMWRKGWDNDLFSFPREGGFNEAGGKSANVKLTVEPERNEGVVGTAVEHGIYQEFGTRFMRAQPFMRPSVDAIRGASASEIAKQWGREAMERAFKRRQSKRTTR
jgi:HK97 gp10 family phage protein